MIEINLQPFILNYIFFCCIAIKTIRLVFSSKFMPEHISYQNNPKNTMSSLRRNPITVTTQSLNPFFPHTYITVTSSKI